jgi:hypothetical protein
LSSFFFCFSSLFFFYTWQDEISGAPAKELAMEVEATGHGLAVADGEVEASVFFDHTLAFFEHQGRYDIAIVTAQQSINYSKILRIYS